MFCSECGSENRNDRKFCTNCGSPLKDYTKPRENLIMYEDIKEEQNKVKNRNFTNKTFAISMSIISLIAVGITVGTFFLPGNYKLIAGIVAACFYLAFVIVGIVKVIKIKHISKSKKENKK